MVPKSMYWLFWDVDPATVDIKKDADYVIARTVEHGTLADVKWLFRRYGADRIHRFFRDVGHPELTPRTLGFWKAFFKASDEKWAHPPSWRKSNAAPWPS